MQVDNSHVFPAEQMQASGVILFYRDLLLFIELYFMNGIF